MTDWRTDKVNYRVASLLKKTFIIRVPSSVNVDKRNANIGIAELKVKLKLLYVDTKLL